MTEARVPFHLSLLNAQRRHILCMKWGTRYGPGYVNYAPDCYIVKRINRFGEVRFVRVCS